MKTTARETFEKLTSMDYSIELAEKFAIALAANPALFDEDTLKDYGLYPENKIVDFAEDLAEFFIEKMRNITDWPSFIRDEEEAANEAALTATKAETK
ncbi:hypothetical protein FACS1894109_17740 [Spirochaetia bacterium]|nr:hypothetical protein FACS1894109_17740 [Spirochaetia bacterium]